MQINSHFPFLPPFSIVEHYQPAYMFWRQSNPQICSNKHHITKAPVNSSNIIEECSFLLIDYVASTESFTVDELFETPLCKEWKHLKITNLGVQYFFRQSFFLIFVGGKLHQPHSISWEHGISTFQFSCLFRACYVVRQSLSDPFSTRHLPAIEISYTTQSEISITNVPRKMTTAKNYLLEAGTIFGFGKTSFLSSTELICLPWYILASGWLTLEREQAQPGR